METNHGLSYKLHPRESLFWAGVCLKHRIEGIQEAEQIIDSYGFITDFKQFSDLAVSISIEIEAGKVMPLYNALALTFKMAGFKDLGVAISDKTATIILFNLSFARGSGDLRVEIPSVPG